MKFEDMHYTRFRTERQWLEARKRFVTGSRIGSIAGLNPKSSALEVYNEMVHNYATEETLQMLCGKLLEVGIIRIFQRQHKLRRVKRFPRTLFHHPTHERMACTLDGLVEYDSENPIILEVKNMQGWAWKAYGRTIPEHYYAQGQFNMACTGTTSAVLCVLIDGNRPELITVSRDDDFITYLEEEALNFLRLIDERRPPAPDCESDIRILYPKALKRAQIEATDEQAAIVRRMIELEQTLEQAGEEFQSLLIPIQSYMGEFQELTYRGDVLATWKNSGRGRSFRTAKA